VPGQFSRVAGLHWDVVVEIHGRVEIQDFAALPPPISVGILSNWGSLTKDGFISFISSFVIGVS